MTPEEKAKREAAEARREQLGLKIHNEEEGEGKKSTLIIRKRKNKKDEPKDKVEVVEEVT